MGHIWPQAIPAALRALPYLRGMYLQQMHLMGFKSWEEGEFSFSSKLNCFVGPNGSGKTNLLDAIHYLSLAKSYFSNQDQQNIRDGGNFFVVEGHFVRDEEPVHIHCALKRGGKKQLRRNKKEYERLADHIGHFPSVVISPYDRDIITEGGEVRRRFMDSVISQGDAQYLHHLIRYQRALQQRNALLKQMGRERRFDRAQLTVYDYEMARHAGPITEARQAFVRPLGERLQHYYRLISEGQEGAGLQYRSKMLERPLESWLEERLERDRAYQYTSVGSHRDDLLFVLSDKAIRQYGSQGQQKSFLIALKLAQYDFLKEKQGTVPILLLDDIFDKLDEQRVAALVKLVHDQDFGQIFITDTHPERTERLVKQIDPRAALFNTAPKTANSKE